MLEIAQVGLLNQLLLPLRDRGLSTDAILTSAQLGGFDLSRNENYVPAGCLYDFYLELDKRESLGEVLEQVGGDFRADAVSNQTAFMTSAPDLNTALHRLIHLNTEVLSSQRYHLSVMGTRTVLWSEYTDSFHPGKLSYEAIEVALVLHGIQLFSGSACLLDEIHVCGSDAAIVESFLPECSSINIVTGADHQAFVFKTAWLTNPVMPEEAPTNAVSVSMSVKLNRLLDSVKGAGVVVNARTIAELTETSMRTVQRQLSDEGTSLSAIIDNWRFRSALKLLSESAKVKDIASLLGYANTSNFERAFRRWTGVTPLLFRRMARDDNFFLPMKH
jgi:AraC-like DNA-binding protein